MLTLEQLAAISGRPGNRIMRAVLAGLADYGGDLAPPHRLAHYIAQTAHESGRFQYDRELWRPTRAQRRYEGRTDLGNTQTGDGYRYRGRGPIQVTGRRNYCALTAWARRVSSDAPDFEADPDAVLSDTWLGISPLWYWQSGNPTGRPLDVYADRNDAEMITRRINGGLNGYADRLDLYTRSGLVLLGLDSGDVRAFQRSVGLLVDGIAGPATRGAIHTSLIALKG